MDKRREEFTTEEARAAAQKLGVDWATVGYELKDLVKGMKVELEHGTVAPMTNLTNDDPIPTAKIALAHLNELDDYYEGLEKMEAELEQEEEMEELGEDAGEIGMKMKAANTLRRKIDIYS